MIELTGRVACISFEPVGSFVVRERFAVLAVTSGSLRGVANVLQAPLRGDIVEEVKGHSKKGTTGNGGAFFAS